MFLRRISEWIFGKKQTVTNTIFSRLPLDAEFTIPSLNTHKVFQKITNRHYVSIEEKPYESPKVAIVTCDFSVEELCKQS